MYKMKAVQKCIFILTSIICLAECIPTSEWNEFKRKFNKEYKSASEEQHRLKIFSDNFEYIMKHNLGYATGEHSYYLGVNEFADQTIDELNRMKGFRNSFKNDRSTTYHSSLDSSSVPDSIDWRKKGAVTPVKNQGHCGSCWAFSTVGAIEGYHQIKTGKLVSLSESQLLDCDKNDYGCEGGEPLIAMNYVLKNKGIESEDSYPYHDKTETCRFNASKVAATISGVKTIIQGDEEGLKEAVGTIGPVSVGIDANTYKFFFYSSGVFDDVSCTHFLDHGVLVVGYNTTSDGKDYWIVKNSWGERWGIKGYINIVRNKDMCGIADSAIYPV